MATGVSDVGWRFSSNQGHQACGVWTEELRLLHINYRELFVLKEWLLRIQILQGTAVTFDMDNFTAVACMRRQGTSRLYQSKDKFKLVQRLCIYHSARYLPDIEKDWADTLLHFKGTSVKWQPRPQVLSSLVTRFRILQIDLFASKETVLLPDYLTYSHRTLAGDPDTFEEDWNRCDLIYLFPPPAITILSKVIVKLESFKGRALFKALVLASPTLVRSNNMYRLAHTLSFIRFSLPRRQPCLTSSDNTVSSRVVFGDSQKRHWRQ